MLAVLIVAAAAAAAAVTPPFGVAPDAEGVPDLIVDHAELASSLRLDTIRNDDPCLLVEGCLLSRHPDGHPFNDTLEHRLLVRFSTRVWNVGTAAVHLGRPPMPEGAGPAPPGVTVDEWWEYSGCHGHYHLNGYATHRLLDSTTLSQIEEVGGTKTGFCARDNLCHGTRTPHFTCSNQGISVGCADHYGHELACQWIDVTDVDRRRPLVLEITVNEGRLITESNYSNNRARVEFTIDSLSTFHDPRTAATITTITIVAVVAFVVLVFSAFALRRTCADDR